MLLSKEPDDRWFVFYTDLESQKGAELADQFSLLLEVSTRNPWADRFEWKAWRCLLTPRKQMPRFDSRSRKAHIRRLGVKAKQAIDSGRWIWRKLSPNGQLRSCRRHANAPSRVLVRLPRGSLADRILALGPGVAGCTNAPLVTRDTGTWVSEGMYP